MGVADWFSQLCTNIKVPNRGTISSRYKSVTRRLNKDLWQNESDIAHSRYVGSYGRNTAIKGFSDLDMVFELPLGLYYQYNRHIGNGQSALLQVIRDSIRRTYPMSAISGDRQVVVVTFQHDPTLEVMPVFRNRDGSYTYPDANSGGSWKTTNPRPEIEAIRLRNHQCNRNLVPLCRMMRAWKNHWGVPISGLLVDTLAYQFIDIWADRDKSFLFYDWMCRDFFLFMRNQNKVQTYWKAPGSGQYVYGKGLFQYKATRCYNIALEAIAHESASPKREWSAKQKWRGIFGTSFPT